MNERSTTIVQGSEIADYPEIPPQARRGRALRVTEIGEDVLHRRCRDVTDFGTDELTTLVDDMFATMLVAEGVGLAANQVDVDLRLFVYDLTDSDGVRYVGHVANPDVEVLDLETEENEEGCLSVPGPGADLFRALHVRLRGVDIAGAPVEMTAHGYLARCFQHETDHLNGRLYVDLLSKRVRKRVLRDMEDMREEVLDRRDEVSAVHGKEPAIYSGR
ncbi:peptide deformylase [Ruania halotolerans]|uniref:peptide deformylase n=1 Tax=Ruania halotolerans TaxID=2897773 RepID=UPI001E57AFA0|nr:peptide deformylase [Ruania halotolerans]UFU05071.1 peptide deformylase [Ruania halotolerans]